jgi:DNA-binding NtrC family response regulator/tetratricopeptide (TPR) repeat protein/predicted Ser/Thr protein kinase
MSSNRKRTEPAPTHPRYEVVRELGRGGAGAVYLARDLLDGKQEVALKVCHQALTPREVLREFRILRELRHPGIPRAFDCGRLGESGQTYFTMEYVSGKSLAKRTGGQGEERSAISVRSALEVFVEITDILSYVHRRGLLHLDVKPANVILAERGARLIDFGIFQNIHDQSVKRTRGTALFTAPEVFAGRKVDQRSDLYSLGVTFYRVLTGRHPVGGETLDEIAYNHQRTPPERPEELPEELGNLLVKLLSKTPRDRFQSADELKTALLEIEPEADRAIALATYREADFVGRKQEIDEFFVWLEGLKDASKPPILGISGARGEGKTRLVDLFRTELAGASISVVSTRPYHGTRQGGLGEVVESLLVLAGRGPSKRTPYRFLLTALGLANHRPSAREIEQIDVDQIRARTFQHVLQIIEEIIDKIGAEGLVLVFEDLHDADARTRDFVERLGRLTDLPPGIGVVITYRTDSGTQTNLVGDRFHEIRLGTLSRSDLLKSIAESAPGLSSPVLSRIVDKSGNNPGTLHQWIREAVRQGESPARTDPTDLARALRSRIESLNADEKALILSLGVSRRPVRASLLRGLADLDSPAFRLATRSLTENRLLIAEGRNYALPDDLLDNDILSAFDSTETRRVHARIGHHLSKQPESEGEAALHLLRGGELKTGLTLAKRAAVQLSNTGHVEEAEQLLALALEYAKTPPLVRFLREALGDVHGRSGQFQRARDEYHAILDDRTAPDRERLRYLRKLGGIYQRTGDQERALKTFEEALAVVDDVDYLDEHLHVLNEVAALHLFRKEFAQSHTFANRGLELLKDASSRTLSKESLALHRLNLHSILGQILLRQFEYRRAAEELSRSLEVSERIGTLSNTALILNNLGVAYHQSNLLSEALRIYRRATALARNMGDDTALFSIQCNVAGIRARRGEINTAIATFGEVENMPHPKRSDRARMFYLHSRALVDRLTLSDASDRLHEVVDLADALPDPLFGSYGRIYLCENEIVHGRWAQARKLIEEIRESKVLDSQIHRAVDCRVALLESLCGNKDAVLSLIRSKPLSRYVDDRSQNPHHGDLWDCVLVGNALLEVEEFSLTEELLEWSLSHFNRSRQYPGVVECTLLLADCALRQTKVGETEKRLQQARRALAAHDGSQGSRGAAVRIPFLEARLALQSGRGSESYVEDRLDEALAHLSPTEAGETGWLVELARLEIAAPASRRRLEGAQAEFLRLLPPGDRKAYLARDHRRRLGLLGSAADEAQSETTSTSNPIAALLELRTSPNAAAALMRVLDHCRSDRGAIFVDSRGQATAATAIQLSERDKSRVGPIALRRSPGVRGRSLFADIGEEGSRRGGVLYIECPDDANPEHMLELLKLAGALITRVLTVPQRASRSEATGLLIKDSEKTRTLIASSLRGTSSPRMRDVMNLAQRTRSSQLPVLLTGESGSGKDHLARWIHSMSTRSAEPFLALDCSAIPAGLVEAELFGYEAGAFTDAHTARSGCLLAAQGGTVYLDNVDSIPLEVQGKLVRVLETQHVRPIGSQADTSIDIRIIASSKRDLRGLCDVNEFRGDMYFRLAGICLDVPPLRERIEDIPDLVRHFCQQLPGMPPDITTSALEIIKNHAWPGNVRELESLVRRLALTAEGPVTRDDVLHGLGLESEPSIFPRWVFDGQSYEEAIETTKREYLLHLFDQHDGDLDRIARVLGTTKRCVYLRFSRSGLRTGKLKGLGPA